MLEMGEIRAALHALILDLPYGVVPEFGHNIEITRSMWDAAEWNPPLGFPEPELGVDLNASAKPTWDEILQQIDINNGTPTTLDGWKEEKRNEARLVVRRMITKAYGETSLDDEIILRLGQGHTAAQDRERVRLVAKYREVKGRIDGSESKESLSVIDVKVAATWDE